MEKGTQEEAIERALVMAREKDANATYDKASNVVLFCEYLNC